MISRLKWIDRWALMKNATNENLSEHSLEVAMIAHALCVIGNRRLGKKLNGERAALIGMYHDATEIITGDMPTPVKYYNDEIKNVYKDIERIAGERLLSMLPEEYRSDYLPLFEKQAGDEALWVLVKAADKISALIKCIEETRMGNREFEIALKSQEEKIRAIELPEVKYFCEHFLPAYYLTLDEHTK